MTAFHVSDEVTAVVWEALTHFPRNSIRQVSWATRLSKSQVTYAMRKLRAYGYISYTDRKARSVVVNLPFVFLPSTLAKIAKVGK